MKFSEKLTELRHSRGWSQEQLGERLGVTRQTVSKWELGSTTPELEKLAIMSDIFGVSTDELIKGEPQEASRPFEPSEPAEAIQDTKPLRSRLHFEYKSRRTVRGLPLVHINFGVSVSNLVGLVGCPAASLTAFSLSRASCPFFAAQYSRSVIRSLLPFKRSIW